MIRSIFARSSVARSSLSVARLSVARLSVALLCSCSTSNVYDASLTLPGKPLGSMQGQVQVAGGFFPQTRPEAAQQALSIGGSGTIRFAPFSWLTLQGRFWAADAAYDEGVAMGYSASAHIRLDSREEGWRFSMVPSFGWTGGRSDGESYYLEGRGASLILASWLPSVESFRPYVGIGPAFGWNDMEDNKNGWGGILNLGTHYMITNEFSVLAELTTIAQVNRYEEIAHLLFSPIIGVSYVF
ncbi:MAG: hypothetical protein JSS89_05040 [Bacteroidetes bacterium]|nr:hypothetical protein [Bacteroidota bacterium]